MDKETLLSQMNNGRQASLLRNWMDPIFAKVEDELIKSLKSSFMAGKYTELVLACHTAQLCALDQLRDRIRNIEMTGVAAARELQGEPEGEIDG